MTQKTFPVSLGDEIFLMPLGNFARSVKFGERSLKKGTVTKVGRKYFYVTLENSARKSVFCLHDCSYVDKEEANGSYIAFPSEEEYEKARQYDEKLEIIKRFFDIAQRWDDPELTPDCVEKIFGLLSEEPCFRRLCQRELNILARNAEQARAHD